MIPAAGKILLSGNADSPIPYKTSIDRVTLATMSDDLRTDLRSAANGGERRAGPVAPAGTSDAATEAPPTSERRPERRRFLPFKLKRRRRRNGGTEASNGGPATADGGQQRRPERKRKPSAPPATAARNGGAPARTSVPKLHGVMLSVLVLATVVTGLASLLFSFGNVRNTLVDLGWEKWLASLYTPAVDVTVIALIVVGQYLVNAGIAPERLTQANRLLAGAGLAMLGANVAPSVISGYVHDHPADYGRAVADAVLPAILIAWSHTGPLLIGLFAEIRNAAEAAALDVVERRTWATEADRAEAAAALADARTEAARILAAASEAADQLRAEASEELAAAASVRQREAEAAAAAELQRTNAARSLTSSLAEQERTTLAEIADRKRRAETEAAGAGRQAELLAQRAQAELTEARRLAAEAAEKLRAAEAEKESAAEDRRVAEELLAAATAGRPRRPRAEERREPDPVEGDQDDDRETVTSTTGRLTIEQRVKLWKEQHPDWRDQEIPDQRAITEFFPGLKSADTISKFRRKLEEEKAA